MELLDLPNDVLIDVLRRVDRPSLFAVANVCRRLNSLSSIDVLWKPFSQPFVLCPSDERWHEEICKSFTWKEVCRISHNWVTNRCKESRIVRFSSSLQMPWIRLGTGTLKNKILVTEGSHIISCAVNPNHKKQNTAQLKSISFSGHSDDVVRFVEHNGKLVSCSMDKTVRVWCVTAGKQKRCQVVLNGHSDGVYCVDASMDYIASGSKDETVKVWAGVGWSRCSTLDIGDHIWSVLINPFNESHLFVGTAARVVGASALQMYDTSRHSISSSLHFRNPAGDPQKIGAGILQLRAVDEHCVMSCGYDAAVRCWDARTGQCVRTWDDPYDNAIYSLASNGNHAFVTGACRFGTVRLWDCRCSDPVKTYATGRHSNIKPGNRHRSFNTNSPVYSVQMTMDALFVGLSYGVVRLSFR